MADRPRVTIGMPVYNGGGYIGAAIDSILGQTFGDLELVICDNASTDNTEEVIRERSELDPRIRYWRNTENLGAAANYNLCFARSQGEYFKWAAHDDIMAVTFLDNAVPFLDREPNAVLCSCDFEYIDDQHRTRRAAQGPTVRGETAPERIAKLVDLQLAGDDVYWSIFGLIRSSALRRTNLIENYLASDQTLLFHLALLGDFVSIYDTLWFRREHAGESMVKHRTNRERARWFDAKTNTRRARYPNWRLLTEHLRIAQHAPTTPIGRLRCHALVLRRFVYKWRALAGELTNAT